MQKFKERKTMNSLTKLFATGILATWTAAAVAAPPAPPVYYPDILITGMSTHIYDNKPQPLKLDDTYFGVAQLGVHTFEHWFEIRNIGQGDLVVDLPAFLTDVNLDQFQISHQPAAIVPPGQRTSFAVRYTPTFPGKHYARVNICSNDPDTQIYDFVIRGDAQYEPLVGPDLKGELVYYSKYKCEGIPQLCKMNGHFDVTNLSWDHTVSRATVRVYVVKGDVLNDSAYLVAQKTVKDLKKYTPAKPGEAPKPYITKRVKFTGYVPAGYTHIYAEVVPEDGSEDIDYTNNRTGYLYGL